MTVCAVLQHAAACCAYAALTSVEGACHVANGNGIVGNNSILQELKILMPFLHPRKFTHHVSAEYRLVPS